MIGQNAAFSGDPPLAARLVASIGSGRAGNVVRTLRRSQSRLSGVRRRARRTRRRRGFASHVELYWTLPEWKAFFEQLSTFCRVLLFDKAGLGLSDPVPKVRTLDDRAAEIEAVMDAAGFGKSVLFGVSESGPATMVFAATRPERTRAFILYDSFSSIGFAGWDDVDRDPAELRAGLVPELGEEYTPSTEQLARLQEFGRNARSAWGTGAATRLLLPSVRSLRQLAMLERMCTSPGMARATIEAAFRIDVRPILPTITAPSLVIHVREDPGIPVQCGRYLADQIPGARYLEVDGVDHAYWLTDPDRILTGIEEFLTGSHAAPAQSHHALRTVLFTDIVASTQHAAATGDERWRAVLHRFGEITSRTHGTIRRHGGEEHRRRPPRDVRRPNPGDPLRRGVARGGRDTGHRDPHRHSHRRVRTAGRRHRGARRAHRGADPRPGRRRRHPRLKHRA